MFTQYRLRRESWTRRLWTDPGQDLEAADLTKQLISPLGTVWGQGRQLAFYSDILNQFSQTSQTKCR